MHCTWPTSTSCSNCKSIFCCTDSNITCPASQPTATLSWNSILGNIYVWQCFALQRMQRENCTWSKQESSTTARWHCSSTQGVCCLPKFPHWILWAIKRCAQCILPSLEDMYSIPFQAIHHIKIKPEVLQKFQIEHVTHFQTEFGLQFSWTHLQIRSYILIHLPVSHLLNFQGENTVYLSWV